MPRLFTYEEPPIVPDDLPEYLSRTMGQLESDLFVGDWITPTLQNNWVNFGSGWEDCQYMRTSDGFVHIVGLIKDGDVSDGITLFTLPEGYRPQNNLLFVGATFVAGGATGARLDVMSDGRVRAWSDADNGYLSLSGIHFYAEQ